MRSTQRPGTTTAAEILGRVVSADGGIAENQPPSAGKTCVHSTGPQMLPSSYITSSFRAIGPVTATESSP